MKKYAWLLYLTIIVKGIIPFKAVGQETAPSNLTEIQNKDLTFLWTTTTLPQKDRIIAKRPPIGFVGDDFKRLHIHFTKVHQNPKNALIYLVKGKTMIDSKVVEFQGNITIEEATIAKSDLLPIREGTVKGTYMFMEDSRAAGAGMLRGTFESHYEIDSTGKLSYADSRMDRDDYKNNQFKGTKTEYVARITYKCNWGDYRIPESGDLDIGASIFSPSEKYDGSGWENYRKAYIEKDLKALEKEKSEWWK